MKMISTRIALEFIVFVTLVLTGCATNKIAGSQDYEKMDIPNTSIKETIQPGAHVFIETHDLAGRFVLLDYKDDDFMICRDEYYPDIKSEIAINDIEKIYIKEIYSDEDADMDDSVTASPAYKETLWEMAGNLDFLIILTLAILLASI